MGAAVLVPQGEMESQADPAAGSEEATELRLRPAGPSELRLRPAGPSASLLQGVCVAVTVHPPLSPPSQGTAEWAAFMPMHTSNALMGLWVLFYTSTQLCSG